MFDTKLKFRNLLELRSEVMVDGFIADSVLALSLNIHQLAMLTQQRDAEESQRLFSVARLAQRVAREMEEQDPTYPYSVEEVLERADIELRK